MEILNEICTLLQQGRAPKVKELITQALDMGINAQEILEKALLPGMSIIGEKFKNNEIFVPEVLIAARAMNAGTEILKPYLVNDGVKSKGERILPQGHQKGGGTKTAANGKLHGQGGEGVFMLHAAPPLSADPDKWPQTPGRAPVPCWSAG